MKRIKKISTYTFFIVLFLIFPFCIVHADDCAEVKSAVNELEKIENFYKTLDCDNATKNKTIYQCNNLLINKSTTLGKIFQYNDDKTCPSVDLSSIIEANKGKCSNEFSSRIKDISDTVMKIFFISAPFILVLFGSLDFFKIVVESDPRETKKHRSNFIKRIVAFVLLYLTPFLVRSLFSLTPYNIDGSYICNEQITLTSKISTGGVTGTYGGNNYKKVGSSKDGQAIADAAKEIKEHIVNVGGYTWGCNSLNPVDQLAFKADKSKKICCAELVAPSLLKAGIYDEKDAKKINNTYAAYVGTNLVSDGWEVVWNLDELEPGDVLLYQCLKGNCHITENLDGKDYRVGHIDIYYGEVNGQRKKVTTGGSFDTVLSSYNDKQYSTDSAVMKLLCGLRYTGKK